MTIFLHQRQGAICIRHKYGEIIMTKNSSKKIDPKNNAINTSNANKGTSGTNRQYDQNQGNRGKQMNPNQNKK